MPTPASDQPASDQPAPDWSALHHGIDPDGVVFLRGWLQMIHTIARPVLRVPPTALTVAGAVLAVGSVLVASAQPWVALAFVLLATLCDALDGAVAVLANRATAFGAVADKFADRIADSAFALVVWRCGAPLWLAFVAGALSLLHETVREVRGGVFRSRITVAERPTRVICTVLACLTAAVSTAVWPVTICAAVWAVLAVIGLAQLNLVGRHRHPHVA